MGVATPYQALWVAVRDMREAQSAYFVNRSREHLLRAKRLEGQVDQLIAKLDAKASASPAAKPSGEVNYSGPITNLDLIRGGELVIFLSEPHPITHQRYEAHGVIVAVDRERLRVQICFPKLGLVSWVPAEDRRIVHVTRDWFSSNQTSV